jgi:hypothetical protein
MFLRSDARRPRRNPGSSSGVNREARNFPQTKSTFRSFFLLKFPSNLQLQPSSLQHQPQHSTSITVTSCSGTRCCDRLPPHPLTLYFFVHYPHTCFQRSPTPVADHGGTHSRTADPTLNSNIRASTSSYPPINSHLRSHREDC